MSNKHVPRPDFDSSSMYGYEPGSAEFKPNGEAVSSAPATETVTTTPAVPASAPAPAVQ